MARAAASTEGSVQRVIDAVSAQIFRGQLRPGEAVNEIEMAELLGVSRTPVREALGQLIVRGLLEKEQGRSARVRRPSLAELVELYEIRILLESNAAQHAAELITSDELTELAELEERMRVCPEDEWLDVHRDFHALIVRAAKRPRMSQIVEDLRAQSEIYVWYGRLDTDRQAAAPIEHRLLLDSIRDGNGALAAETMCTHLRGTVKTVTSIAHSTNGQLIPLV